MKPARLKVVSADEAEIPLQEASFDIWDKKYRLKSKGGAVVDQSVDDTYRRVARALADVEATPELRESWYERFVWALRHGAIPAGRIVSNAGAQQHKPATSTINCTVSGTVRDSMDDILAKVHEAGLTLRAGCGIGYEFSTLRPKGGYLRQDVLHGLLCRWPPRCADGDVRRRSPRRRRLHPRQARGRPAAPVQPVAAGHQ